MADNEVIGIDVIAKLEKFEARMAEIPGIGGKEAKALAGALSKEIRAAERAAKSAAQAAKKAKTDFAETADEMATKAGKLSGALDLVSPTAGGAARAVADLSDAAVVLGNPAGLAAAAVAGIGLAAAGTAVAMGAAVLAADEALDNLKEFGKFDSSLYPSVDPATIASIEQVNAAGTALGAVWDSMVVTVGANVAPAFAKLAAVAVGLADAAAEQFGVWAQGKSLIREVAVMFGTGLADALTSPLKPLQYMARGLVLVAELAGAPVPAAVSEAVDAFGNLSETIAESVVDWVAESDAVAGVTSAFDDFAQRGEHLLDVSRQVIDAREDATAAARDQAAAEREAAEAARVLEGVQRTLIQAEASLRSAVGKVHAERDRELAQLDELIAKHHDNAEIVATAEQAKVAVTEAAATRVREIRAQEAEEAKRYAEDIAKAERAKADAALGFSSDILTAASDLSGTLSELEGASKAQALAAFNMSKGLALAAIPVQVAAGIMKAIEMFGPPPSPLGIMGIASAGATGATQAVAIAAAQPPSLHVGGTATFGTPAGGGLAPDERYARVLNEESILTSRGTRAAGGPAGVDALNRGQPMGGTINVDLRLRHRSIDRTTAELFSRPSLTAAAVRGVTGNQRSGHRV